MFFDNDDNWTGCREHDGAHSVIRDEDGPEPCDAVLEIEQADPGVVLNFLECAGGSTTVMQLSDQTGYLVETIEAELERLERKGLAFSRPNAMGTVWYPALTLAN